MKVKDIKKLLEVKIVYLRKSQDRAKAQGKTDKAEMYKFMRWALEEILEEGLENRDWHLMLNYYERSIEEAI